MSAPFAIGAVGHFGLAVREPRASADWYVENLGLKEQFVFDGGIVVGNEAVTLALFAGTPSPATLDHVSFHLPDVKTLRVALTHLQANGVPIEDPGDEIGPEAEGSPNVGLWFSDPGGYRLELSVLNGATQL